MCNIIGPLFFRYLFIKGTVCITQSPCSWNCFIYFRIHLARICTFAGMSGFQQLQCSMPAHPSCAFCDWFNIWKAALWKDRTIRMLLASARPGWASKGRKNIFNSLSKWFANKVFLSVNKIKGTPILKLAMVKR